MDVLKLVLGQIPEAIYFALFLILTKELKEKRLLFTCLMIVEYIFLKCFLVYTTWFHVIYFILTFIILKVLYRDKANITDIFTLGIASIVLIVASFVSYTIVYFTCKNMIVGAILVRVLTFGSLFIFKNKLSKLDNLYKKLWNRSKIKYKMKSTTFRALNLVIFNISFIVINLGILFHNLYWR
jgi:hypothetical protein